MKLAGPSDVELQRKQAASIEDSGNRDKALVVLRQAEKNDPRDFRTVRELARMLERAGKGSEAAEKLKKQIAEATPEELAALWRAGKLDARDYNRANPRKTIQKGPSQSEPGFYVGPRGGRYRINSSGRKSYDVP